MDLDHLRRHYAGLDDDTLVADWSHGPSGYGTPEIWEILATEVKRRGLGEAAVRQTTIVSPEGVESRSGGQSIHYAVLVHRDGRRVAVKRGFCWPAFFLTWMWALAQRLWGWGLGAVLLGAALSGAARSEPSGSAPLLFLGIALLLRYLLGSEGNRARERMLIEEGFHIVGTVPATTAAEALARMADADRGEQTVRTSGGYGS